MNDDLREAEMILEEWSKLNCAYDDGNLLFAATTFRERIKILESEIDLLRKAIKAKRYGPLSQRYFKKYLKQADEVAREALEEK